MSKTQLVIASVLKPVDDTRMYEKIGLSLSQTNKYEINIIGFYSKKIPHVTNIRFYPIFKFSRISFQRLLAPLKFFKTLLKLKPKVILVNTHELLLVTGLYKILFGAKIIYDIRENYFRNILYTKSFPLLLRPLVATYVRSKEYLSNFYVDHYLLAEKGYKNELTFCRKKCTVIENKYKPITKIDVARAAPYHLLFTGTLAESTGVFEAVALAQQLHKLNDQIHLTIVGYCALGETWKRLQETIAPLKYITLIGGHELVSHHEILHHISRASFGVICYPDNRSIANTIPTKLYEYIGNELPILLTDHQPWIKIANHYQAGIGIDFNSYNPETILHQMESLTFYKRKPGSEILWQNEELKLLAIINKYTS